MLKRVFLAGVLSAVIAGPVFTKTSTAAQDSSLAGLNAAVSGQDCMEGFDARIGGTLQIDNPTRTDQPEKQPDRASTKGNCTVA